MYESHEFVLLFKRSRILRYWFVGFVHAVVFQQAYLQLAILNIKEQACVFV
jgi:hypothetical protein